MKVLSIGTDKNIFINDSAVARRVIEYGGLVDKYAVVVPADKSQEKSLTDNVAVYGISAGSKFLKLLKIYNFTKKILSLEKYDVITVQDQYYLAIVGWLLARKFDSELEIQLHGFEKFRGIRKWVAKFVLPRADSVRTVSQRLKRQLISDFGVKDDKITVVPIRVDLGFTNYDLGIKNNNGKFIFLTAGRLVPVKNIGMQIEAMVEVIKKYPQAELWIAGDGPERKNLEARAKRLEVSGVVRFLGWQKDLKQFYEKIDVFLLTSNAEGWPLVIVEAASFGLPIIMTDVGSAGELINNNESGLVIPVGGGQVLEEAMRKLIEDNDLRERLGKSARQAILNQPGKEEILALYKKSWERALDAKRK